MNSNHHSAEKNQHRIVLSYKSQASDQVGFDFPKTGPTMGELEDVEIRLQPRIIAGYLR